MTGAGEKAAASHLARLLKLLQRAGGKLAAHCRSDGRWELDNGERHFTFPQEMVEAAICDGYLVRTSQMLALTRAGRDLLARLDDPCPDPASRHRLVARRTVKTDSGFAEVSVNELESPLSRLFVRKDRHGKAWLSAEEFAAGERIRADFERAGLSPRISASWSMPVASGNGARHGKGDLSDFALDSRRRLEKALALLGHELANTVLDICCFLKGLEEVEREHSWPPRSAKLMLRTALRMLTVHYGLCAAPRKSAPMRHWGGPGYRPRGIALD